MFAECGLYNSLAVVKYGVMNNIEIVFVIFMKVAFQNAQFVKQPHFIFNSSFYSPLETVNT